MHWGDSRVDGGHKFNLSTGEIVRSGHDDG
jgi:hypothetical protein